jgi:hypothetical protein
MYHCFENEKLTDEMSGFCGRTLSECLHTNEQSNKRRNLMRHRAMVAAIIPLAVVLSLCMPPGNSLVFAQTESSSDPGALHYGQAKEACTLKDNRISESSGIAASIVNKDAFWTHNDSGDSARIFLFNKNGETIAVAAIKGVTPVDWEDIASFKRGEAGYLLIGDTGDNFRMRKSSVLYIIREPLAPMTSPKKDAPIIEVTPEAIITFSYENGPHDCESIAVDPTGPTLFLASKEPKESTIYSLPFPPEGSKEPSVAKAIATLKLSYTTAMDISPDGKRAVILTYGDAYEFVRSNDETWAQAFSREPRAIKAPQRKQGEGISYGPDGKTLYLTSEGISQPLWEIPISDNSK